MDKILIRRNKVSLFDHFKGLPLFLKTMPQSLHFYPRAKKMSDTNKLYEGVMNMTKNAVLEENQPYYNEFFDAINNPKIN